MKVLLTGATGLIGSALISGLRARGIEVNFLTTRRKELRSQPGVTGFYWNPEKEILDEASLSGVDAIIHLAGASISKRWTRKYKQEIIDSRIVSANHLFKVLKSNPGQVKQFVSASAIGIYKDSLTREYTESDYETDHSFIGNVVTKWENAADRFAQLGLKVAKIRTGLVLSEKGGMLTEVAKPVKLGFGAAFGSGKQWQSWVHIDDMVGIYVSAVEKQWEGTFSASAPNPVTQSEFVKQVAKTLKKPFFMPNIPVFVLKLMLGEMHILLVTSQKVRPENTEQNGYRFKFPELQPALDDLLK